MPSAAEADPTEPGAPEADSGTADPEVPGAGAADPGAPDARTAAPGEPGAGQPGTGEACTGEAGTGKAGTGKAGTEEAGTEEAAAEEAESEEARAEEAGPEEAEAEEAGAEGVRGRRVRFAGAARFARPAVSWAAGVLVLGALLMPNGLNRLTPFAFTRIPVEGLCCAALLLVLRPAARRAAAVGLGVGLGLLVVLKSLDMGFYSTLDRPFDLVLDWILLDDAQAFLRASAGTAGAVGAVALAVLLVLAVLVLMPLAVLRVSRVMARHSATATRSLLVLGTVWVTCAALGVQLAGVRVASTSTSTLLHNRAHQVRAGVQDKEAFAREARIDAFRDTPPDQLLTRLRGKDVLFTFIESYGRTALEDPAMAAGTASVLADGTDRLERAGFSTRSAFLTSPVTGAGSWLAHATFLSGLWIKNEQRYRNLTSSDRMTLTGAFRGTGAWRTVGIMPGVTKAWPEGKFYGLDHVYDSRDMGYRGPKFSWTPVPDQYSLAAFERLEHGRRDREPIMAEIILASSHNPWSPIPEVIGWDEVGDGSVYHGLKAAGKDPKEVWQDSEQVRTEYRRAIAYSMNSVVSYLERYGDEDTVVVLLGDHQPVPTVTRGALGRDVPVSVIAKDPEVMERIADWQWQDGLKPAPDAPVWRMDSFRDRFLTAYGP
ncbi:sulfatase [Streptomyces lycii]|uniref:Sulfatase n=2 Tax=Streptomyces lycii TaxID=2654337 RepID=A0ABQ7FHI7_9ACTN|nr:sulfatase [Streptomyces lycii]